MIKIVNKKIIVSNLDTFNIPFVLTNHVLADNEKVLFTVCSVKNGNSRTMTKDKIVFQKTITKAQSTDVPDADGQIVGSQIVISATKQEAEKIPVGHCWYDLALINDVSQTEYALIAPSEFDVVEVLR